MTKFARAIRRRVGSTSPRVVGWLTVLTFVGCALLAYSNSFQAPFVLDDETNIVTNGSIRHLWPLSAVLHPPYDAGVGGRPLLNLTFALNWALGGANPVVYHIVNLFIHLAAGLTAFGLMSRTLCLNSIPARVREQAHAISLAIAAVWFVHPVQTACVTYVSQRAESLMGLFFLLTMYGFVRALGSRRRTAWFVVSWLCCLAGMTTKEVTATVPLIVLLYDRAFVAGSLGNALRARRSYYLALATTWLVLPFLMVRLGDRAVGYGLGIPWWEYTLIESRALIRYLQLAVWPAPLVFDYGRIRLQDIPAWPLYAILCGALMALACASWRRLPKSGFLAVAFFIVLAPTSSIIPIAVQPMAENRLYLPLLVVSTAGVLIIYAIAARFLWPLVAVITLVGGVLARERNETYRSELSLWRDTVVNRPANARAWSNLSAAYYRANQIEGAISAAQRALRLHPNDADACSNLAAAYLAKGNVDGAIQQARRALAVRPDYAAPHLTLTAALLQKGDSELAEAKQHAVMAIARAGDDARAHSNLGNVLLREGKSDDAIGEQREAVRLDPTDAKIRLNYAQALQRAHRFAQAQAEYEHAIRLRDDSAAAHIGLAQTLAAEGSRREAVRELTAAAAMAPSDPAVPSQLSAVLLDANENEAALTAARTALALNPSAIVARLNLGIASLRTGKIDAAVEAFQMVVAQDPMNALGYFNLGNAYAAQHSPAQALAAYQEAVRLDPSDVNARANLGSALLNAGEIDQAVRTYREVVRLSPSRSELHYNLARALAAQKDAAAATAELEEAIRLNPQFVEAHAALAGFLLVSGATDQANRHVAAAIALRPDDPRLHLLSAKVLLRLGQIAKARIELDKTLQLDPQNPETRAMLDGLAP